MELRLVVIRMGVLVRRGRGCTLLPTKIRIIGR